MVVQTEVTYAPSPRRIGKKKVKLNPVIRKSAAGGNCPQETNSPSQSYDKQPPVLPVLLPSEQPEKKNVIVIGGKRKPTYTGSRKERRQM